MVWWILLTFFVSVVVVLTIAWAFFTAQRLNRLNIRTDSALMALGAALDRRAAVIEVVFPHLASSARSALAVPLSKGNLDPRVELEEELNAVLASSLPPRDSKEDDPQRRESALVDASVRVELALRFYNDAVTDTKTLRSRPMVRLFRLQGNSEAPEYCEIPGLVILAQ